MCFSRYRGTTDDHRRLAWTRRKMRVPWMYSILRKESGPVMRLNFSSPASACLGPFLTHWELFFDFRDF